MHYSNYPPMRRRAGSFSSLALTTQIMALLPYGDRATEPSQPRRKSLDVPQDNDTYVKPIKQCFVKNPRLMPMTKIMLTLLSGWAGDGGKIETTTGIIAKHISRCRRQIFRYLKDAVEEGYLHYSRTKDREGRYIGIRIWLNFPAIRFSGFKTRKTAHKAAEPLAMTYESETNRNHIYITNKDDEIWKRLLSFGEKLGYFEREEGPS